VAIGSHAHSTFTHILPKHDPNINNKIEKPLCQLLTSVSLQHNFIFLTVPPLIDPRSNCNTGGTFPHANTTALQLAYFVCPNKNLLNADLYNKHHKDPVWQCPILYTE
jgi:hypothetical protein